MTVSRSARVLGTVVVLLFCACSGGGGDDDADPSRRSSTTSSTTSTPVFTGDAGSDFCRLLAESEDRPVLDPFEAGLDPRDVELRFRALQLRFAELADVAPTELEDDIEGLVTALDELGSELEAADYDFAALAESGADVSVFDDESFLDAAARVDAYRQQVCE